MLRLNTLLAVALIPVAACGQRCKQMIFQGRVEARGEYSHPISSSLSFHLTPPKGDSGWTISVDGKGSGEDWSYPVAYPLRTGEKQHLGTGYGEKMTS